MSKKNTKNIEPTDQQKRQAELLQMKQSDPSFLKQDIFRLKEQLLDLVNKKQESREVIENIKDENVNSIQDQVKHTFKIEITLKHQEQNLVQIENEHSEISQKHRLELKELMRKYENEEDALMSKNAKEIGDKNTVLEKLKQKVEYLTKYPQRKRLYMQKIAELNEKSKKMQKQQQKDIINIREHHLKERTKQEQETETEMRRIKQTEVNRLQQKMTTEQFVKKQNEVMSTEIALCEQQIQVLMKECSQLKGQIQAEKSQAGENMLGNQANETYERSLRIIKLENKLAKLKTYHSEQTARLQKQYEDLDITYTKKQEETQAKISKIEGWLRIKQRDLKKVKACSQMVLDQRSNLQSYLLQVFYEHPETDYKDERNINKVLRFLFAKINSKKAPLTYKNFLPASLKSLSSSNSFRA